MQHDDQILNGLLSLVRFITNTAVKTLRKSRLSLCGFVPLPLSSVDCCCAAVTNQKLVGDAWPSSLLTFRELEKASLAVPRQLDLRPVSGFGLQGKEVFGDTC